MVAREQDIIANVRKAVEGRALRDLTPFEQDALGLITLVEAKNTQLVERTAELRMTERIYKDVVKILGTLRADY